MERIELQIYSAAWILFRTVKNCSTKVDFPNKTNEYARQKFINSILVYLRIMTKLNKLFWKYNSNSFEQLSVSDSYGIISVKNVREHE